MLLQVWMCEEALNQQPVCRHSSEAGSAGKVIGCPGGGGNWSRPGRSCVWLCAGQDTGGRFCVVASSTCLSNSRKGGWGGLPLCANLEYRPPQLKIEKG